MRRELAAPPFNFAGNLTALTMEPMQKVTHRLNLLIAQSTSCWQLHDVCRKLFRNRQWNRSMKCRPAVRLSPMASRREVCSGKDAFSPEKSDDLIATQPKCILVDHQYNVLAIREVIRVPVDQPDTGDSG